MIQNRRSRVNYKYRKTVCNPKENWIIVENTHEALVDKETFKRVQELLPKQRQRNDKKEIFLFDGLLKCADCGHNIGIRARRTNGKTSTVCNYYRKYRAEYNLCTSHGFDYDNLEKGVIDVLSKVMNKLNADKIEGKVNLEYNDTTTINGIKNNIQKLNNDLEKLKLNLDNMYMDKLNNKVTEEMHEKIKEKINSQINITNKKIEDAKNYLEKIKSDGNASENLNDITKEFLDAKIPTRDLILKLINYISIHDDGNIDIYFNFKELNIIYESCVA